MRLEYYLLALILTLIIELSVAYIFGFRNKKSIITIIVANLITHPLLCYFLLMNSVIFIIPINYFSIIVLEILVVLLESILLFFALKQKYLDILKLSFGINIASFLVGLLIFKNNL